MIKWKNKLNEIWKKWQCKADNMQSERTHAKMFKSETYKRIPMVYPLELQIHRSIKRIFLRSHNIFTFAQWLNRFDIACARCSCIVVLHQANRNGANNGVIFKNAALSIAKKIFFQINAMPTESCFSMRTVNSDGSWADKRRVALQ